MPCHLSTYGTQNKRVHISEWHYKRESAHEGGFLIRLDCFLNIFSNLQSVLDCFVVNTLYIFSFVTTALHLWSLRSCCALLGLLGLAFPFHFSKTQAKQEVQVESKKQQDTSRSSTSTNTSITSSVRAQETFFSERLQNRTIEIHPIFGVVKGLGANEKIEQFL